MGIGISLQKPLNLMSGIQAAQPASWTPLDFARAKKDREEVGGNDGLLLPFKFWSLSIKTWPRTVYLRQAGVWLQAPSHMQARRKSSGGWTPGLRDASFRWT